jgi:hypothetical protein
MSPITELIGGAKAYGWSSFIPPSPSFDSIATLDPTGGTFSFDSIPQTYKHLQIRIIGRTDINGNGTNINMRFNNDTGNTLIQSYFTANGPLLGNSLSASAGASAADSQVLAARVPGTQVTSNRWGSATIDIIDYSSTDKFKNVVSVTDQVGQSTYPFIFHTSTVWASTSAITSVNFIINGGSAIGGTRVSLYGIKAA